MWGSELRNSQDVSVAAWIAPRLSAKFGAVTRTVPGGYPAYARVCHPPTDPDGRPATWSQVAQVTRRQVHPLMQWHALVGAPDSLNLHGSLWPGDNPEQGNLVPELLGPLCDLLAEHTTTPEQCFFCLWEGYGWIHGGAMQISIGRPIGEPPVENTSRTYKTEPAFPPAILQGPKVRLPTREYLLFVGSLSAASTGAGNWIADNSWSPQSPNLLWPADQAWCVASEIDFDSTLVGGSTELIHAILQSPMFDAWPVGSEDSLAHDADQINLLPQGSDASRS